MAGRGGPSGQDTTLTKVFVGGLAWETQTEALRRHFEVYGEIVEAAVISDRVTGRSKGYGFVTFREQEAARRAVTDPSPVIDGRRANCNLAAEGLRLRQQQQQRPPPTPTTPGGGYAFPPPGAFGAYTTPQGLSYGPYMFGQHYSGYPGFAQQPGATGAEPVYSIPYDPAVLQRLPYDPAVVYRGAVTYSPYAINPYAQQPHSAQQQPFAWHAQQQAASWHSQAPAGPAEEVLQPQPQPRSSQTRFGGASASPSG
eukprot:jgi/Chlat1/2993/Chrsp2S04708